MYKLLLTFRYLRRKLIPLFAMVAVTICTAMVIIVLSVMGGFLELVRDAGRTLMGDVAMYAGLGGFPHYEALIDEIEALPQAEAAAPTIVAYGLLGMPEDVVEGVQVLGIDGRRQTRVTEYEATIYWTRDRLPEHPAVADRYTDIDPLAAALDLHIPWAGAEDDDVPLVMGIEVSPYAYRMHDGTYQFSPSLMATRMTLNVLPVTGRAGVTEPQSVSVVGVNKFHSGVFDVDDTRVYVPFHTLQAMMQMDEAQRLDRSVFPPRPIPGEVVPARTTELHVRAAPGYSADDLRQAVRLLYDDFVNRHDEMPPPFAMQIQTWEQRQAQFLRAVQNERNMMAVLFGIISITAVVMIGVIFYRIVLEKTRDIGILRAIGASKAGVAAIFLSFSAVIGIIGAALGSGLAYLFITYINDVHNWLGYGLGGFLFLFGLPIAVILAAALFAVLQNALRSLFELSRLTGALAMPAIGLALGLAFVATYAIFVYADRLPPPALGWPLLAALAPLGAAALFAALGAAFAGTDRLLGRRSTAKKALALAATLGALAWLIIGLVYLRVENLIATLNQNISVQIWDRSVYFFERIPNQIDWFEAGVIVVVAVVASLVGALTPAIKAGLVDPIESLRYE